VDIHAEQRDSALIVSVVGDIDALTADEVRVYLETQVADGQSRLVLDLSQVQFMSSSGVRLILGILKSSREQGGDLCLAATQPGVSRTLQIAGLSSILKAFPSVEEAISSLVS
jgi:anti-anti-sigma factor